MCIRVHVVSNADETFLFTWTVDDTFLAVLTCDDVKIHAGLQFTVYVTFSERST